MNPGSCTLHPVYCCILYAAACLRAVLLEPLDQQFTAHWVCSRSLGLNLGPYKCRQTEKGCFAHTNPVSILINRSVLLCFVLIMARALPAPRRALPHRRGGTLRRLRGGQRFMLRAAFRAAMGLLLHPMGFKSSVGSMRPSLNPEGPQGISEQRFPPQSARHTAS